MPTAVVTSASINANGTTTLTAAPSSATNNVGVTLIIPPGTVPPGTFAVIAALPSGIAALYRVNGRLEVLTSYQAQRLHARLARTTRVLPVNFTDVFSFYMGIYFQGSKREVVRFNHPLHMKFTGPTIFSSSIMYETYKTTWVRDPRAKIANGRASIALNTDRGVELINLLGHNVTLRYNDHGGRGVVAPLTVAAGTAVTLDSGRGVTLKGYQFVGWSRNGRLPALASPYLVKVTQTLQAIWITPRNNVVRFEDNGGMGRVKSIRVHGNATITLPTGVNLQRNGYVFAGWSSSGSLPVVTGPYLVTRNVVFRAVWLRNVAVELFYNTNGGRGAVPPVVVHGSGLIRLSDGRGVKRSGYVFAGWSSSGSLPAVASPFDLTATTTLRAIWITPRSITLRYDSNAGRGHVPSVSASTATIVQLNSGYALHRKGYAFAGWSLNGTFPVLAGTYYLTQSTVLKAVWQPVTTVTLTYNLMGGGGRIPSVHVLGSGLVQLNYGLTLHRKGYAFAGWSLNGQLPAVSSPYDLTTNTTLEAIWQKG